MTITLHQLLATPGAGVMHALHLADPDRVVVDVSVHEPGDEPEKDHLLVVVGTDRRSTLRTTLERCADIPAAVVIRHSVVDAEIVHAARQANCSLLRLDGTAKLLAAVELLRAAVLSSTEHPSADVAEVSESLRDLYELADVAADALGAPVTIEDERGTLVAYSQDQEGGDDVRIQTIVSRRAPAEFTQALSSAGILKQLSRTTEPLVVRGVHPGAADRAVLPLLAGPYRLGAMWALTGDIGPRERDVFKDLAHEAALRLMQRRNAQEQTHRLELEKLGALLHGGAIQSGIVTENVPPEGTHWVAAVSIATNSTAERAVILARIEQRLAWLPRSPDLHVLAGQMSNLWYLIVTSKTTSVPSSDRLIQWLADLVTDRASRALLPVHVGLGRPVRSLADLPRSRKEAEQALAVARTDPTPTRPLAIEHCWARASLQRLLDPAAAADLATLSPLSRLTAHDQEHGTNYVPTLRAWLETHGSIRHAAQRMHVHTNTLRYRIEKLQITADVNLDDAETRLVLAIQLYADQRPRSS